MEGNDKTETEPSLSLRAKCIKRVFDMLDSKEQLDVLSHISPSVDYLALDFMGVGILNSKTLEEFGVIMRYIDGVIEKINCTEEEGNAIAENLEPMLNSVLVIRDATIYEANALLFDILGKKLPWFAKEVITLKTPLKRVLMIIYLENTEEESKYFPSEPDH